MAKRKRTGTIRIGCAGWSLGKEYALQFPGEGTHLTRYAERFAAALPNGQLVTVPRCGHNVHSQNTAGFLEAVHDFLAANS